MKTLNYEATRIIVENTEGEILLLVRRMVQPTLGQQTLRLIQVPGGQVEEDESPLGGAMRELSEETGLFAFTNLSSNPLALDQCLICEDHFTAEYTVDSPQLNLFQRTHIESKSPLLESGQVFRNVTKLHWFHVKVYGRGFKAKIQTEEQEKFESLLWVPKPSLTTTQGLTGIMNIAKSLSNCDVSFELLDGSAGLIPVMRHFNQ